MPLEESLDDSPLPFNVLQTLEAPDSVEQDFHVSGQAGIAVPPPAEKRLSKRTKLLKKVKSLVNKPKYRLKELVDSSRQTGDEVGGQVTDIVCKHKLLPSKRMQIPRTTR